MPARMPSARVLAAMLLAGALATPAGAAHDFVAKPRDFKCITSGEKVPGKNFYIQARKRLVRRKAMKLTAKALATDGTGFEYPVGTILQVFPGEAMVKRKRGFNPAGGDWEFFRLAVSPDGTTAITARGAAEVKNRFGSCQGCHAALANKFDLVCEYVIGTAGLGLTDADVAAIQAADPRCATK